MSSPLFTVIIPAFGRPEPLRYTLRSAAAAARRLGPDQGEIIVVDDGSPESLETLFRDFPLDPRPVWLHQTNAGSMAARARGLAAAKGAFIQFLDSDDLLHPDKLTAHAAAHADGADVVTCELAEVKLDEAHACRDWRPTPRHDVPSAEVMDLWLGYQPAPHCITYRRTWLQDALSTPRVAPLRAMDPSGDVWLYYNLLEAAPPRHHHLASGLAAIGPHPETRYSQHWENLGAASLLIAEKWIAAEATRPSPPRARIAVGCSAFTTWRGLPTDFSPALKARWLEVWRRSGSPRPRLGRLTPLARFLGPVLATRVMNRLKPRPYSSCRTLDEAALERLLSTLPPP